MRWHFDVAVATKDDMAYHPDTEQEISKRKLGIKLSFMNTEGIEEHFWILSQKEARTLAEQLSGKLSEIMTTEYRLDHLSD